MARMTQSLLSFTQQADTPVVALAAVADMVAPVAAAAEATARERGIALTCEIAADLPFIACRQGRIGQVVTALLANAMESWGEGERDEGRRKSGSVYGK
jgi:signal transduction histidine kinase